MYGSIRNDVIMAMGNIVALVWLAEKRNLIKQAFQLGHELSSSEIQTRYIVCVRFFVSSSVTCWTYYILVYLTLRLLMSYIYIWSS